jgi:Leucine-rich repeat (LRR) protein
MISGSIPTEIGELTQLEFLRLAFNELSGELPTELAKCQELQEVAVGDNKLVGTLPAELGSLNKLLYLDLQNNKFIAPVSDELGGLQSLRKYANALSLCISMVIKCGLTSAFSYEETLVLNDVNLGGSFPTVFSQMSSLSKLSNYKESEDCCLACPHNYV